MAILDMHMPELDGQGFINRIRADPTIANVKLILLTSLDSVALQESIQKDADGALTKPVKQSQLLEALQTALGITADRSIPADSIPNPAAIATHSL